MELVGPLVAVLFCVLLVAIALVGAICLLFGKIARRVGIVIIVTATLLIASVVGLLSLYFWEDSSHYHTDSEGTYDDRSK